MSKHIQPISHYPPHERLKTYLIKKKILKRQPESLWAVLKNSYFRPCFRPCRPMTLFWECVHMCTRLENDVLRKWQQPGSALNIFIDQGEFEAMKMPIPIHLFPLQCVLVWKRCRDEALYIPFTLYLVCILLLLGVPFLHLITLLMFVCFCIIIYTILPLNYILYRLISQTSKLW